MLPFGSRILVSNLMVTLFMNFRTLVIGRVYTSEDLGFFNRGKQFPRQSWKVSMVQYKQ